MIEIQRPAERDKETTRKQETDRLGHRDRVRGLYKEFAREATVAQSVKRPSRRCN